LALTTAAGLPERVTIVGSPASRHRLLAGTPSQGPQPAAADSLRTNLKIVVD